MDIKDRYNNLFEQASSPISPDISSGTAYFFQKYCKNCFTGIVRPPKKSLEKYKLFGSGFCSQKCFSMGARERSSFPMKVKDSFVPSKRLVSVTEDMAFTALKIKREETDRSILRELVKRANLMFFLLSEKLAFLENETDKKWYPSKFYYWLNEK